MRQYKIALMLQDFCFGDNYKKILSPEIQNIYLLRDIQKMSDKGNLYQVDFVLNDGTIVSDDLTSVKGSVKDNTYDFIFYVHQQPSFDSHRICINWVPQEYLTSYAFWQINNDPFQASSLININVENYKYNELNVILRASNNKLLTENSSDCIYYNFNPFIEPLSPKKDFKEATIFYSCATLPLERHGKLIKALDKKEYCNFYGSPSCWKGTRNYKKQIPYGYSLYNEINKHGISLAIHSKVHTQYEYYTNRVMEACFSGTLIITDNFTNLKDIYGDTIFTINTTESTDKIVEQIENILNWVRSNPEKARKKVLEMQKIFSEKFIGKDWIYNMCDKAYSAKSAYIETLADSADKYTIDVIYHVHDALKFKTVLEQILKQYNKNYRLIICCHKNEKEELEKIAFSQDSIKKKNIKIEFVLKNEQEVARVTGYYFEKILEKITGDFFTFINETSMWNEDHISRLVWQFDQDNQLSEYICLYSGVATINDDKFYGLDGLSKQTIAYPINVKSILDFYNPHLINIDNDPLTSYTKNVELRFPKGAQLFKKEALDVIDQDIKKGIKVINDCEHIAILTSLAINNKMQKIHFSPYISYHIQLRDIENPKSIKGSLYPNALKGEYLQSFNSVASQLSKIFFDNVKFRSFYSLYGIHEQDIIIKHDPSSGKILKRIKRKIKTIIKLIF